VRAPVATATVTLPHLGLMALALGAAIGCKGTASPSSAFGINLTVDAKALSADQQMKASVGSLQVTGSENEVKQFSIAGAITSGALRFRFIPKDQTGTLKLHFDALDSSGQLLGSGDSPEVTLAPSAVSATITLTASAGTKKGDSAKCTTDAECGSGFCTDGVCCNERCQDTCVSCALASSPGLCVVYDKGSDPEKECTGSISTGADGGTAVSDAGPSDASINAPEGGIVETPQICGGSCSGARACAYADPGLACGKAFCNTRRDVAGLECDGKGNCAVSLTSCVAYACDDSTAACRTNCNANIDCQTTSYCNGTTSQCAPQKVNGITCATDAECNSGHCSFSGATGVCCNTACDAPNTCNNSGSVGKCSCPGVTCAAGVACQIFYQDADVDGYGNKAGSITAGTAVAGCAGAPPTGFVADNTDCDDKDANVHPGQTGYFGVVSKGTGTYDYDCDGTVEKSVREYPGASCKFCPTPSAGCSTAASSTCSSANAQESLACTSELLLLVLQSPAAAAAPPGTEALTIQPLPTCCGCDDHSGFLTTVNCGASASYTTCGICTTAMGAAGAATSASKQQLCH
jgi:hypothetical protein